MRFIRGGSANGSFRAIPRHWILENAPPQELRMFVFPLIGSGGTPAESDTR
jgi:hypothetical protein